MQEGNWLQRNAIAADNTQGVVLIIWSTYMFTVMGVVFL